MKGIIAFASLTALAFAGPATAIEDLENSTTQYVMEEVVVTATKTKETRRDIPNAIVLLDREDIETTPAGNIAQLLGNEPGIDWRSNGNYGGSLQEIHIRGMGGSSTQVLVNGVRYNSPSLGLADVGKVVTNAVERIEVVKGAGSLLYGSGAMAGTVAMITKRPDRDKTTNRVSAGFGTESTYGLAAEHGIFVGDDFGYYLTASYTETDGFRANSDLEKADVSFNLVLDKGEKFDLSLYGDYVTREYGVPGVVPEAGTANHDVNGVTFVNSEAASLLDRGEDEDSHLILQADANPYTWLGVKFSTDLSSQENLHHGRYAFNGAGSETITTNEIFGSELVLDFHYKNQAHFLMGVEYDHFDWENDATDLDTGGRAVTGTQVIASDSLHTNGTFAEVQFRLTPQFKILGGVRYEDHSTFGTETLPMAGLVINPCQNTAIKFSHGKHFLAPTLNDLFWPEDAWGTKGNPNLEPENGHHTDITLEQNLLDGRLFFTASYFRWDINNKILWDLDDSWSYTPQNLNAFQSDGLEIGIEIGPFFNVSGSLAYTYTDADEENNLVTRDATYVADSRFKARLTFWTGFGMTGSIVGNYVGQRPYYGSDKSASQPVAELDSYWTADLKIEQEIANQLLLSVQALNILDEEYNTNFGAFYDPVTFASSLGTFPGAGRSIFANITFKY